MAGIDDLFKSNVVTGLAVGVGVAILAPVIVPIISSVGKPLAKSVIKSGILLYEKSRETVAELGEVFEDLVAEAKAELEGHGLTAGVAAGGMAAAAEPATAAPVVATAKEPAAQGDAS